MMPSVNEVSPADLATGSRVTLVGLQNAAHLNNRQGVLIGAPTRGSTRHEVYILRSSSDDWKCAPLFVRAKPGNIMPSLTNVRSDTLHTHPSPTVPHPLTTLLRTAIQDTIPQRMAPTTFFFGTVPPTYLLRGVPLSKQNADILVLGCGDIRSILYTVSRRNAAHGSLPKLRVTLNDIEPCVMARNVIMLWLILRTPVQAVVLSEIWFSLRLSASAYAAVVEAVAALTGPDRQQELRAIGVEFCSDSDRTAVYQLLEKWISWRDKFNPNSLFASRAEMLNEVYKMNNSSPADEMADSTAFCHHVVGDAAFPRVSAYREIKEYISTGCVFGKHPQNYPNPTMFKSPDKYSLHFESVPFNAFPPFAPQYDKTTPLRTPCANQLKDWVSGMREHGRDIKYVLSTADCLAFAMGLKGPFDIVAMSNVTDVIGLLPVLQATRGLVAPSGYMFTQTFKLVDNMGYVEGYLRAHLGLPLELVPAVLGWRCVGWEGKNNPDHCVVNAAPGSDGRTSQTLLTWKPTGNTNVPLDASACAYAQSLYTTVRDRMWISLTSSPNDIHDAVLPLRIVHPLVLIPIFASACNVAKIIDPESRAMDVEFGDVLGFVTAGKPSDIAMASVSLPRSPLCVWGLEPSDPRDIFTVRLDSGVQYAAVEVRLDENTDSWILSWKMSRERARGVKKMHLMYSGCVVVSLSIDDVEFSDLSRDLWNCWLQRACSPPMGSRKMRRVEREECCDIIFDIPEGWMKAAMDDSLLVRPVRGCDHSVEVVNPVDTKSREQIHLPYPIDRVCGNLQVDDVKKEAKFEVRKAKYRLQSLFLPDSQNKSCWFETRTVPHGYVKWLVPQQFSPNELLLSELGKLQWTRLCALKGIASTIFLAATSGETAVLYFQHEDEETGRTQSLMLHPGAVRRNECTGNLAVDVKWMHKPYTITPRAVRNRAEWPSHTPMTKGEFEALLEMLEVRSEDEPETEEVRSGVEFLMKSNALSREFPQLWRGPRGDGDMRMYDRMHMLTGGRIGYATLTPMMWPGQVAFLEREGNGLMGNNGMDWEMRVEGWLKKGGEHARRGDMEFALEAFEQGAAMGLAMVRSGERVIGGDALVKCLLEAVEIRVSSGGKNCALISACCNKAVELIGDAQTHLRRHAEKLQSKAIDMAATFGEGTP